jgi:putative oxidoreductase
MDITRNKPRKVDASLLIMRVFLGSALAVHGAHKIFGQMDGFTQGVAGIGFPVPVLFAWLAALSEFAGGLFIALGLFTRVSALFAAVVMGVAFFMVHAADPFRVKELAYVYLVFTGSMILCGGGYFSLDMMMVNRRRNARRHMADFGSGMGMPQGRNKSELAGRKRKSA